MFDRNQLSNLVTCLFCSRSEAFLRIKKLYLNSLQNTTGTGIPLHYVMFLMCSQYIYIKATKTHNILLIVES